MDRVERLTNLLALLLETPTAAHARRDRRRAWAASYPGEASPRSARRSSGTRRRSATSACRSRPPSARGDARRNHRLPDRPRPLRADRARPRTRRDAGAADRRSPPSAPGRARASPPARRRSGSWVAHARRCRPRGHRPRARAARRCRCSATRRRAGRPSRSATTAGRATSTRTGCCCATGSGTCSGATTATTSNARTASTASRATSAISGDDRSFARPAGFDPRAAFPSEAKHFGSSSATKRP